MIPVKVAVHQVTDRLVRNFLLDLRQQRSRSGRLRVGIHNQDVAIQYKDSRIAVSQCLWFGQRGKDSVCYFLDGKESGVRRPRLSPRPTGSKECFFKDRRSCQHTAKAVSKKVAAVVMVVMVMVAHG